MRLDIGSDINKSKVSVIVPCRNERENMKRFLDSVVLQNYPKSKTEVLIIDGESNDGTIDIIEEYVRKYQYLKLLRNTNKIVSAALNLGVKVSNGDVIIRMDAHSIYESNYISRCVDNLYSSGADNVGGVVVAIPGDKTAIANSIALVLSCRFGVGNAYHRIGVKKTKKADTVPFGCYRRTIFDEIGLFNENLVRSQDYEFNTRIRRRGGRIIIFPEIVSYYCARPDFKGFIEQNYSNGFWVLYSMKYAKLPFTIRHVVPFSFFALLLGSLLAGFICKEFIPIFFAMLMGYIIVTLVFSFYLAIKSKLWLIPILFISFLVLHFSYGVGSVIGSLRLMSESLFTKAVRSQKEMEKV